jgi:MFS family permease
MAMWGGGEGAGCNGMLAVPMQQRKSRTFRFPEPPYAGFLRSNRVMARLWWGSLVSTIGDILSWTTLTWVVVERSGSGSAVAIMLLAHAIPSAITGPLIGRWLDKGPVRALVLADNILRASVVALVPILDHFGLLTLPAIWMINAVLGALSPATRVGLGVAVPRLTVPGDRTTANTAFAAPEPIATIAGPALAGFLLAKFGLAAAMCMDALSFIAMAWAAFFLPNVLAGQSTDPHEVTNPGRAQPPLRHLLQPLAMAATLLSALFFFSYGPSEAALPLMIQKDLQSGAGTFGGAWSALGMGAVLGGMAAVPLDRLRRTGLILGASMASWGVITLGIATVVQPWQLLALYFVGGLVWGPYLPLKATLMQRLVPASQLGAVLGLQGSLLAPTMPLGAAVGGWMLVHWSPRIILASVGWACVGGALAALAIPALHHRDPEPRALSDAAQ